MGEQRAIRWTDVDFELRRVFIRRSSPGASTTIKAPKSNRLRWVDLTPDLANTLKAIKHRGYLIFCQEDGSMLNPGQFHEVLWLPSVSVPFGGSRGTSFDIHTRRSSCRAAHLSR